MTRTRHHRSRRDHARSRPADLGRPARFGRIAALFMLLVWPLSAVSQVATSLVADSVTVQGTVLVARGNVTVFGTDARLSAQQITYDRSTDVLRITGPITLTGPDGSVIVAEAAQLSQQLRSGLLISARLVLDQRLQLTAARADKDQNLTQLTSVAVTSCHVCAGRAPLWSIRAGRVVHDAGAQRLWFEDAQLRVRDQTVLTLPQLSLPDPSATRASGLLRPGFSQTSGLGATLRLPYFLSLSPQRDLTITPVISQRAVSAEFRLRQALPGGGATVNAMLGRDQSGRTRAYMLARADTDLPGGWRLSAIGESLSDRAVIQDYGLDARDRLHSTVALTRIEARRMVEATVLRYSPLTTGEDPTKAPMTTAYARLAGRTPVAGGLWHWDLSADAHGADAPDTTTGRIGIGTGYTRRWIIGPGIEAETRSDLRFDQHESTGEYGRGSVQMALHWPLMRRHADTTHIIAPMARIGYLGQFGTAPENTDSTRIAFDETALGGRAPAPGDDLALPGAWASAGLSWTMFSDHGQLHMTAGRLLRAQAPAGVSASTGLGDARSDWLLAAEADLTMGLKAATRMIIAPGGIQRSETRLGWQSDRLRLDGSHLMLAADAAENRPETISLVGFDAGWDASISWSFSGGARYDIARAKPISANLGANWRNECVSVGISASHRFASLSNVAPTTEFGLELSIEGFSASQTGLRPARSCPPT